MKLAIGNDHVAVEMKKEIKKYLEDKGIEVIDVGVDTSHEAFAGRRVCRSRTVRRAARRDSEERRPRSRRRHRRGNRESSFAQHG